MSTGLVYVGYTTKSLVDRWKQHQSESKNGSQYRLHQAIAEYGAENFCVWIIEDNILKSRLKEREQYYIDLWNTVWPRGYNSNRGGGGVIEHTSETKKILREKLSGEKHPRGMLGKKHTPETKKKQSDTHIGKKHTPETKKKQSDAKIGEKNPFYGKRHKKETKEQMSKKMSGEKNPTKRLEVRKKISISNKRTNAKKRYDHDIEIGQFFIPCIDLDLQEE